MKTKRSSLRNSVVENNNEKTAVYSQNGSVTDIMATDDGKFQYSKDGGQSFEEVSTQVDTTLSTTSENPVQNKVITENINNIVNNVTKIENSSGGGAVGAFANCSGSGGAIGFDARTSNGFAGGMMAKTVNSNNSGIDAIQLGTGTNSTEKTLQIYNDNIYNANTHTLTSQNVQVSGNITDGTNTVTVADIATKNDIPTNNNQLENGAGYITSPEFIEISYDLIGSISSSNIVDNTISSGAKNKWIFNKMFYEVSTSDEQSSIQTIYNFLNSLNLETDKVYNCLVASDVGILLKRELPGNGNYFYRITAFGERNCYFHVAKTATGFRLSCYLNTNYNNLPLNGIWK